MSKFASGTSVKGGDKVAVALIVGRVNVAGSEELPTVPIV
jgi:hypothetical protein